MSIENSNIDDIKIYKIGGQKCHFNDHIKAVHEGQRCYKCDTCEETFQTSVGLKSHIKTIHEGRKDHKCDHCGKCFAQFGKLNFHIKTVHEGPSKYFVH